MIVTTLEALRAVVAEYMAYDEFVVDLETIYPIDTDEVKKRETIRAKRPAERTVDDEKWAEVYDLKATDPLVNDVIWIGLAGPGGSSVAIPVGHPKGRCTKQAHKGKLPAYKAYAADDHRRYTKHGKNSGKLSSRMINVMFPAEYAPPPPQLDATTVFRELRPLFFSGKTILGWNIKFDLKTMSKYLGEFPPPPYVDVLLSQHLLNESMRSYKLGVIVPYHFDGYTYDKLGSKGVQNFSYGKAARYVVQDCRYTWLIWRKLKPRIQRHPSLWRFHIDYEMKIYEAIMLMEHEGVMMDRAKAVELRAQKEKEIDRIKDKVFTDFGAPDDFNFNAADQVRALIYDKYKAKKTKMTPGGVKGISKPSTDAETLTAIAEATKPDGTPHQAAPVAKLLLEYAEQNKVLTTYLIKPPFLLDAQDRLHADYLLYGTETSRLSCREPNIQNIPRESEMRGMYIAPPGHVFVIGDYNQIELRKIAVEANDPALISVFNSGEDSHRMTAALVLNKPFADVTPDERQNFGKMPNFLLGFGGGPELLAEKAGISLRRAEMVHKMWFRRFNRVDPWKATVLRAARRTAVFDSNRRLQSAPYVETMLGRRRRLPNLLVENRKDRSLAERQAVNTIIQGSCAETTLLAMVDITAYTKKTGFPLKLVINVHDELVATVPKHLAEEGVETLESFMSSVKVPHSGELPLKGKIPLEVKVATSDRWEK